MIDKKFFVALIVVASVFITLAVQAEIKTYTGVGEDYANQYEKQEDAKFRALKCAIEDAKKQAGVGLKSYSRSINSELVDDEISTITSNSYKIVGDVKYERLPPTKLPGSRGLIVIGWKVTVDVDVDDAEVKNWFKRDAEEKKALINRNRAAEEAFNEDIQTADDLKKRAAGTLTEIEEFDLKHEVEAANNDFQVNQKIEEGNRLNYENKPAEATKKYKEAWDAKFFDGVGEYRASVDEDLEIAKQRSFDEAKQAATENVLNFSVLPNAKMYVKSFSKSVGIDFDEEMERATMQVLMESEKTVEVVDVKRQIIPVDDSHLLIRTYVRVKIILTINTKGIDEWVAQRR